ncbi:MarR family winged helix-turn-helix transcriptional regulator [Desulfatitalea alkaliphila]|uniref:MarR family transcriptional regulator n=1 Tax=Desulfatitalea alkaliphila TaxID=2929485 RepID=A0AA41R194_9BACT|nr:MarR family transcriptional regulator [Desulfatitalea alkaliphila]MCJ8499776.1 MarR family transcriptional regulator [Desulfatitalea alkaliphila]
MPSQTRIDGIEAYARRIKGIDMQALREGLAIAQLHRQVEQAMDSYLAAATLSARQIEIMESLYHHPEGVMTPADLAEEVHLTRSSMTGLLDALERRGYAQRDPHPGDRRKLAVSLTSRGREFLKGLLTGRYRKLDRIMGSLTSNERAVLLRAYRKVLDVVHGDLAGARP